MTWIPLNKGTCAAYCKAVVFYARAGGYVRPPPLIKIDGAEDWIDLRRYEFV